MRRSFLIEASARLALSVTITLVLLAIPFQVSRAENLLGLYVGAAVGHAQIEASAPDVPDFRESHSAYKFMAGIRPISLLGVEIAYDNFGHPSQQIGYLATNVSMKGESAFGILYLPVPVLDVFFKAGLARIDSTATTNVVCLAGQPCIELATPGPESRTNVGLAAGAGAQFKIGSLAVRGEYERFNAAGGNPSLWSIGVIWKF
jgi:opacity protein-like surface antigen